MTAAVTILLPTYNGARFLDLQIQSILNQSFDDFTVLAIDDGSVDASPAILADNARIDRRLHVLPSTDNQGQKQRLFQLSQAADTPLISIADQDDVWDTDKLGRLVQGLGNASMAFGPSRIIDADGRDTGQTLFDALPPAPSPCDRLIYLFKPMVSAHAMVARREVLSHASFQRAHPFDWLQSLDASFMNGIRYVEDAVTWHRLHGQNQSNGDLSTRHGLIGSFRYPIVRRRHNLRQTERWMVTQRLEHLSFSPMLDLATRRVFDRAFQLCAEQWFRIDRGWSVHHGDLRQSLSVLLRPMASSEEDWAACRRYILQLTRSAGHPWEIAAQTYGAIFR